jgi:hypothetical protein
MISMMERALNPNERARELNGGLRDWAGTARTLARSSISAVAQCSQLRAKSLALLSFYARAA